MANPIWAVIAVAAAAGKAYATYQSGMAQKAYYDAKADEAKIKYKTLITTPFKRRQIVAFFVFNY